MPVTTASLHIEDAGFDLIDARPWRVMIAEDSALWRHIIHRAIIEFGADLDVVMAGDGRAAREILSSQPVDLAFLDLALPEINGDDVVCQIREHGKMPFFVVVSVTSDAVEIARMRRLSAYDYLVKPFDRAAIQRVLSTYARVSHPTRVLVVDDSGTQRTIIAKILRRSVFNFEIHEAGDGVSAFEAYADKPADIVFLDLNMPGLDGAQTMRLLRAHNPSVRIVVMSGSQDALDRVRALGVDAALKKPFNAADLDVVVHRLFDLPLPYSQQ